LDEQIKKNEMSCTCGAYGERRAVYRILVGELEGKRPLGRPRHRWENNIKINFQELGWEHGMD